uniref:Nucleotide-diphospho-sugar transferase domain-containing protein n=1 Tax=viral metagenome TaxID=1070528 RepID=A0A6C0CJ28_9ZZZZ
MRIVCMTNEAQLPMMKSMLNSALKCGFPMSLFHCYILGSQQDAASYGTQEFTSITTRKLHVIRDNMLLDDVILWVDNDIVFFENCLADLLKYKTSFVMQDDLWSPCTGFFLARTTSMSVGMITKSIQWLVERKVSNVNDQHAFAAVKKMSWGITITLLPQDEYPNGKVYFEEGRKEKAKMVHSNFLVTTSEKIDRFKQMGLWNESDEAFNLVNKYFI